MLSSGNAFNTVKIRRILSFAKDLTLPNDKIIGQSYFTEYTDDNFTVAKEIKKNVSEGLEIIVGKRRKMLIINIFSFSNYVFRNLY